MAFSVRSHSLSLRRTIILLAFYLVGIEVFYTQLRIQDKQRYLTISNALIEILQK